MLDFFYFWGVANKFMAISKDFFTSSYRTYVLNDFSIVAKAMFYGLELSGDKTYKLVDKLPVQINPDSLECIRSSRVVRIGGIEDSIKGRKNKKEPGSNTLRIEAHYNIYDEYNVRTNYGMTGALDDSVSLANEDFTSLPKLQSYANKENMFVLFRWGDVNFFGQIESVSCTYDTFSQWGNPLSCRATISVEESAIKESRKDKVCLDCFSEDVSAAMKSYEDTMKVVNSAALVGMDLTSEVSGLVLGGIQGALR